MARQSSKDVPEEKATRLQRYHRVVDSAELIAVQLVKSNFEVKPEFFNSESVKGNLGYEVEVTGVEFAPDKGVAMVFITLTVDSRRGKRKLLSFSANYLVVYDGLTDCDEEAVDAFVRRVATFACYPYFRSLFANMDWAATTRLPPLPVLKEPARASDGADGG